MESCSSPPSSSLFHLSPIFFFTSLSLLSLIILSFSLYKCFFKTHNHHPKTPPSQNSPSQPDPNSPTHLTKSVLFQTLPSDPDSVLENSEVKKKKRKAKKKKKMNLETEECANTGWDWGFKLKPDCLYPFTSSRSVLQRKIKQQYDELVKINDSKKLTLPQVVKFGNSLIDARKELQHKADVIQRKFVITKALLCKADRSSYDRLHQQIYKLELEQKRLEEDAFVYNSLQCQLKLSPAYQKMLELGAGVENVKKCEPGENINDEFSDISFEELLAKEKKDSFWQKNGKSRMCSS
ncbi:CA-responsive protein [Trifolium repens]|nr:CA-responsive protein [Trifolium repens]